MREAASLTVLAVLVAAGFIALLAGYFLPTIVALIRRPEGAVGSVVVLNLFLGWTLLGWVASLAMPVSGSSTRRYVRPAPPPQAQTYELPIVMPLSHVSSASIGDASQAAPMSDASSASIGSGL